MTATTKSLREVANYKPLRECGIDELAAHQWTANPSGGVLFARRPDTAEKDRARDFVVRLFTGERHHKGLSILTMPGVDWTFERALLRLREGQWEGRKGPHRTHLTAIESDRAIYHAALTKMPGLHQAESFTSVLKPPPFAERAVRNRWVGRFFFANVDDLMRAQPVPFDAAWLDYTGPLSVQRMKIIADFYARNIRSVIVVTSLRARWNLETCDAIARDGDLSAWVRRHLPGRVMHDLGYQDGSPMSQIAIRKVA